MYHVSGANLHGQWFHVEPILYEFQTISRTKGHDIVDIDQLKLIHMSWSYNIFQGTTKFFISGSWNGQNKQLIEVQLPKEVLKRNILISGNEYNLFLFETDSYTMWIMNLEDANMVKKVNIKTEVPSTIKRLKVDDIIVKVCATNFYCICLTAQGTVYGGLLPGLLDLSNCIGGVSDVQCGYEHYLLLTDNGRVYSWGNGRRLQLGHGDLGNVETPKEIEALGGINITQISAGGWHSLALSECGDVYAWGWNETGQLGIKETDHTVNDQSDDHKTRLNSHGLPTLIDIFNENGDTVHTNVKHISCGNLHSAIMLEDNSVWTTGCNKYGQLGLSTETIEKVYHFKKTYQCSHDSLIRCGPWVTVIQSSQIKHDKLLTSCITLEH